MRRLRGDGERAHAIRLHEAEERWRRGDRGLYGASNHVLHHLARALVWYVHDLDTGLLLEELHTDVQDRAAAASRDLMQSIYHSLPAYVVWRTHGACK